MHIQHLPLHIQVCARQTGVFIKDPLLTSLQRLAISSNKYARQSGQQTVIDVNDSSNACCVACQTNLHEYVGRTNQPWRGQVCFQ